VFVPCHTLLGFRLRWEEKRHLLTPGLQQAHSSLPPSSGHDPCDTHMILSVVRPECRKYSCPVDDQRE